MFLWLYSSFGFYAELLSTLGGHMRDVHVSYGAAPRAQAKLVFAIDLARRLSARLYVWIEEDCTGLNFGDVVEI